MALTKMQDKVLMTLTGPPFTEGRYMSDIMLGFRGIPRSTVRGALDNLVRKGYADRDWDKDDRPPSYAYFITDEGIAALQEGHPDKFDKEGYMNV